MLDKLFEQLVESGKLDQKTPPTRTRAKRTQVQRACNNCKRLHARCDNQRPCQRCVQSGCGDSCVDAPRKRRITSPTPSESTIAVPPAGYRTTYAPEIPYQCHDNCNHRHDRQLMANTTAYPSGSVILYPLEDSDLSVTGLSETSGDEYNTSPRSEHQFHTEPLPNLFGYPQVPPTIQDEIFVPNSCSTDNISNSSLQETYYGIPFPFLPDKKASFFSQDLPNPKALKPVNSWSVFLSPEIPLNHNGISGTTIAAYDINQFLS